MFSQRCAKGTLRHVCDPESVSLNLRWKHRGSGWVGSPTIWGLRGTGGDSFTLEKNNLILIYFFHSEFSSLSQWPVLLLLITELPHNLLLLNLGILVCSSFFNWTQFMWFLDIYFAIVPQFYTKLFFSWIISLGYNSESEVTTVSW